MAQLALELEALVFIGMRISLMKDVLLSALEKVIIAAINHELSLVAMRLIKVVRLFATC